MANAYHQKPASYYIKQTKPRIWEVAKFDGSMGGDSSEPSQVYHVKGDPTTEAWGCDCPASWATKNRPAVRCKHGPMVKRWIAIIRRNDPKTQHIYYDSQTDKFYPLKGLME